MKIRGIGARLDDEDIRAAHVFQNLEINFAVAEFSELGFAAFHAQVAADIVGQATVGASAKDLKLVVDQVCQFPVSRSALSIRERILEIESSFEILGISVSAGTA